ncbi:MAG TPA: hypothetical protein PKM69_05730, partial [Bacteroidales bacterium]|nr:hypothetical protein [Bacteroidales bacterium]
EILIEKGKVTEIIEHDKPEGTIDPPDPFVPAELRLKGFNWLDQLRPKQKEDIFKEEKEEVEKKIKQ